MRHYIIIKIYRYVSKYKIFVHHHFYFASIIPDIEMPSYTGMRVSMRFSNDPESCELFEAVETENYLIKIVNPCALGTACNDACTPDSNHPDCIPFCTYEEIDFSDFENGWGRWNDGGSDCRRNINDDAQYAIGMRCVRLRDNTETSVMTTYELDLESYEEFQISFTYYTRSVDNANEDFWLQVSGEGGITFTTVEEWT